MIKAHANFFTNQTTPNVNPVGVDGEGLGAGYI